MAGKNIKIDKPTYDQLLQQNHDLENQLSKIKANQNFIWNLFSETARGLQLSSTSIKMAVSSLLSHDLFWDPSNQHEFLTTINESTNKITQLVSLMTLAFRAQAGTLELNLEPQVLQEILAIVQKKTMVRFPSLSIDLSMSSSEKTVNVDFDYSIMAVMYLIDFMHHGPKQQTIWITADERSGLWFVDILGIKPTAIKQIHRMHTCLTQKLAYDQKITKPESILGLHLACQILHIQQIENDIIQSEGKTGLRLIFPAVSANN